MNSLILVDFQQEWIDPKSEEHVDGLMPVIARTNSLIDLCRKKGYKIIFTRHVELSETTFRMGKGAGIIQEMHYEKGDTIITKHMVSPFYKTRLDKELKGVKRIVVAGILTNMCVRSLVSDAYDRGFLITIVSDCCKTYDKKTHDFTLKDLKTTREELDIVPLARIRKTL